MINHSYFPLADYYLHFNDENWPFLLVVNEIMEWTYKRKTSKTEVVSEHVLNSILSIWNGTSI